MKRIAILVAASAFAAACASAGTPTRQLADTQSVVRAAEEVGAEEEPNAALHLKLARDGIAKAERLIAADKNTAAKRALERAEVDAELALALAHDAKRRQEAESAWQDVKQMRQRLQ